MTIAPPRVPPSLAAPPQRLTPLHNGWWVNAYQTVVTRTHEWLERRYQQAATLRLGPLHGGDLLQSLVLNLLLCLPYLISGKCRAFLFKTLSVAFPTLGEHASVSANAFSPSRTYLLLHVAFLFALIVPRRWYPRVLPPALLLLGVVGQLFDLGSVLALVALAGLVFMIAKAPWPSRPWKIVIVCLSYLALMNICQFADRFPAWLLWPLGRRSELAQFVAFGAAFVPLLWYATYEIVAGRLHLAHCATYLLLTRLFGGPVLRPSDLRIDAEQRRIWQWRGVFSLANALVARALNLHVSAYLGAHAAAFREASGPALAWYSFCYYLLICLSLVAYFNLFVGWARIFGLPIRDVFYFWLLARTPNERWRRWNMLFREWIITYVFYPMMRSGKGVFLAVMTALLCSGLVHVVGFLTPNRFDLAYVGRILGYWTFNGLAVYIVIVFPRAFPSLVERLRMREHVAWSLVGIAATSVIYSVAMVLRDKCLSWSEAMDFLHRLLEL